MSSRREPIEDDGGTSNIAPYATLTGLLQFLGLEEAAPVLEGRIQQCLDAANQSVDAELAPYLHEDIPLKPGSNMVQLIGNLVIYKALSIYYLTVNHSKEQSEHHMQIYKNLMESLVTMLKAERNTRTKTALVAAEDPLQDRVQLPSQRDAFILD